MNEGVTTYVLTQDQINSIAAIASKEGARVYQDEAKKAERRMAKLTDKVEITKQRLRDYRAVKEKLANETYTKEELVELRFKYLEDLMGSVKVDKTRTEAKIEAELRLHVRNADAVEKLDHAYEMYQSECEKWGTDDEKRRCREIYMLYMDETVYKVDDIAEIENVSTQTVYRDIGIASKRMATYLLGF